jgi:nicotinamidase-related amidase
MARVIDRNDPYVGWRDRLPELDVHRDDTALLVIDMQYACASIDHGVHARRREMGLLNGLDYLGERLALVVPNIARLQRAFRDRGMEVVFVRIAAKTQDGRDRSKAHKDLDNHSPVGTREAEILDELAPVGDEMVFDKTTGSAFTSTTLDYVLRNVGIRNLVCVGTMTGGCVESSVRDAKDLGYGVVMVEDACATWSPDLQEASVMVVNEVFGKVKTTDEVLDLLARSVPLPSLATA